MHSKTSICVCNTYLYKLLTKHKLLMSFEKLNFQSYDFYFRLIHIKFYNTWLSFPSLNNDALNSLE